MDAIVIWDLQDDPEGNVQHLREHDVSIEEAEEVFARPQQQPGSESIVRVAHSIWLDFDRPAYRGGLRTCG